MNTLKSRLAAGLLCIPGIASANLIINGNFESGDTGFTSAYGDVTGVANGLATGGESPTFSGEGLYAIGKNPNFYHSAFTTMGDHTSGSGNMMIVNGSLTAGKNVWTGSLSTGLSAGVTYLFSAWVMNVYHDGQPGHDDANLEFSIGGNSLGTFTATGTGVWQEFTATYTPSVGGELPTAVDLKINYYANDFALDDLSLTRVPDGAMTVSLLGIGLLGLAGMRRFVSHSTPSY
jgi:hypothetical protein